MRTPIDAYRALCDSDGIQFDASQAEAVGRLQQLYAEVIAAPGARPAGLLGGWLWPRKRRIRGVYLWGGVGRGKTMLADLFYTALPIERKQRCHFHAFMRGIHQALRRLSAQRDPLAAVAADLARGSRIICLDEFHVSDIADAMILGRLLKHLFGAGVTLVATSNEAPDELYKGGLQRERFTPAIEAIKAHMHVTTLAGPIDYRLRALERAEIYHTPLDRAADESLRASFSSLIPPDRDKTAGPISIDDRPLPAVLYADGIIWFTFKALCEGPRSAADYIEIARSYQTVLVSGIPQLDDMNNDAARRFINLIDAFYDRNVKFICSAAASPDLLYTGKRLRAHFRRTSSRLIEMQSHAYLARPHLTD
jgi:cell division protein ZapE